MSRLQLAMFHLRQMIKLRPKDQTATAAASGDVEKPKPVTVMCRTEVLATWVWVKP